MYKPAATPLASISLACTLFASTLLCAGANAQAPEYKFDAEWPQVPLPNKWWMQGVTGLYVDHEDIIWVLNRTRHNRPGEDMSPDDVRRIGSCRFV